MRACGVGMASEIVRTGPKHKGSLLRPLAKQCRRCRTELAASSFGSESVVMTMCSAVPSVAVPVSTLKVLPGETAIRSTSVYSPRVSCSPCLKTYIAHTIGAQVPISDQRV